MSPLEQRLRLYRFAYVQIDPTCPFETPWLREAPQWVGPESRRTLWSQVLGSLPTVNFLASGPVVAPSPVLLAHVRRRQPDRPLILCQTPFEPVYAPSRLRSLIRVNHWIPSVLWRGDATDLLFWGRSPEAARTKQLSIFLNIRAHPLRALWHLLAQQVERWVLFDRFFLREDGHIEEQLPLFGRPSRISQNPADGVQLRYDAAFKAAIEASLRRTYVFSSASESLAWFARDVVRLLPSSAHVRSFPHHPDPSDPQTFFVTVRDSAIRFARLDGLYAQIHLDWNTRSVAFRRYRMKAEGCTRWRCLRATRAVEFLDIEGQRWCFHLTERGWQSHLGEMTGIPHAQSSLAERIAAWRCLRLD